MFINFKRWSIEWWFPLWRHGKYKASTSLVGRVGAMMILVQISIVTKLPTWIFSVCTVLYSVLLFAVASIHEIVDIYLHYNCLGKPSFVKKKDFL